MFHEYQKTASDCGSVKRGVCDISNNQITKIIECNIEKVDDEIVASPLNGNKPFNIKPNSLVSMNIFGFTNKIYELLALHLEEFFKQDKETILKSEVLLPDCLQKNIEKGMIKIYSIPSKSEWIGMTYKDDLKLVKEKILKLKKEGSYPSHLWK